MIEPQQTSNHTPDKIAQRMDEFWHGDQSEFLDDIILEDSRPQRFGWAPGSYFNKCRACECRFIGDKRAWICADCAYAMPYPLPLLHEADEQECHQCECGVMRKVTAHKCTCCGNVIVD